MFVTANSQLYSEKMKPLGLFDGASKPALTINLRRKVVLPFDGDFSSKDEILAYLQRFLSNRLETLSPEDLQERANKAAKDEKKRRLSIAEETGVKEHFKPGHDDVAHLDTTGVNEIVIEDESKDVVLLVYQAGTEMVMGMTPIYKRVAKRFKELGIESVVVAAIDVLEHPLPRKLALKIEPPSLVLFRAHSRTPPYLFFSGEFRVGPLMQWVHQNSATTFTLPELPQFNDEERELYKQQIKDLELQREAEKEL